MKSFTKKLVLNCTGVIFVSFLIVYFLFNVLVSNYIRAEAERELTGGMTDVVGLTHTFSTVWVEGTFSPYHNVRIISHEYVPYMRFGRFELDFRPYVEWSFLPMHEAPWNVTTRPFLVHAGIEIEDLEFGDVVLRSGVGPAVAEMNIASIRPIRQQSFVNTDVIMIGDNNEVLSPWLDILSYTQRAEVEFLVDYYLSNRARFIDDEMTRVSGAGGTFYLSTSSQTVSDSSFSILMYTDISSAMAFTSSMNRILGLLLVLSGILSLAISVAMSARFKRAVVRLCDYAETIGRGNFNETAGAFNDTEFNLLSKSMNNMSNMLQAYENNQKQFFQNVSHELRTPLMSILGYAEGIIKDIFSKEEAADIILSEGHKMANLVDELLYVSRINNTVETHSTMSNLDAKDLLYECCERVKPIAQKSDKQVIIEPLQQEIYINADEEKLERAVINILSNAIRHAENEVKISYHIADDCLEIMIKDDGGGINPADLPRIFERFYKGENGNYGLGLAISKDIVKSLHGNITAKNQKSPQTGAVFTIVLPLSRQ